MDLFLNLLKHSQNFPNIFFVRYLSYSLLKIHRKLISGYLLCDKATLRFQTDSTTQYTGGTLLYRLEVYALFTISLSHFWVLINYHNVDSENVTINVIWSNTRKIVFSFTCNLMWTEYFFAFACQISTYTNCNA
jgi:hypothetical protein